MLQKSEDYGCDSMGRCPLERDGRANRSSLLHDVDRLLSGVHKVPLDSLSCATVPKLFLLGRQLARVVFFELEPDTAAVDPDPEIGRAGSSLASAMCGVAGKKNFCAPCCSERAAGWRTRLALFFRQCRIWATGGDPGVLSVYHCFFPEYLLLLIGSKHPPFHVHLNIRKTRLLRRNKAGPSGMSNYDH